VDILYRPKASDIYPQGLETQTRVEVPGLSETLCGLSRPGHFTGVATVVNKLFNIVQPDVAYFGKKDYQQLLIIRKMVSDLAMNVEITGVETIRLENGLAMSSRNNYLSGAEQQRAATLYQVMQKTVAAIKGNSEPGSAYKGYEQAAVEKLAAAGFRLDYFSVRRRSDLKLPSAGDSKLVLLAAAWLGKTRLIDNLEFELRT
jgi:pantoate--beta-alanine ligase